MLVNLMYAVRSLVKDRRYLVSIWLVLTVGIGSAMASAMLFRALFFSTLPVSSPHSLVRIAGLSSSGKPIQLPYSVYQTLHDEHTFTGVCAFVSPGLTADTGAAIESVNTNALSGDCFSSLQLTPALGRFFSASDDIADGAKVVVLSFDFWKNQYRGAADVIGRHLRIEGVPFTIIGVARSGFNGLLLDFRSSLFLPLNQTPELLGGPQGAPVPPDYLCNIMGRMPPGTSLAQVRSRLASLWPQILATSYRAGFKQPRDEFVARKFAAMDASGGVDYFLRDTFRQPTFALLSLSSALLILCCANAASLTVVRILRRRREFAIRLALGATNASIAGLLLAESLIVVALSGVTALPVTLGVRNLINHVLSEYISNLQVTLAPGIGSLSLFVFSLVIIAVVVCAVALLFTSDKNLNTTLAETGSRGATARPKGRDGLLAIETAIAVFVLCTATAFVGNLRTLEHLNRGFNPEGLSVIRLDPLPAAQRQVFSVPAYYRALLAEMRGIPGIESLALSDNAPFAPNASKEAIRVNPSSASAAPASADVYFVTPQFFSILRVSLLRGSGLTESKNPLSAVVTRSLGERLARGADPIGRIVRIGSDPALQNVRIVGVAGDFALQDIYGRNREGIFLNYWNAPRPQLGASLFVKAQVPLETIAGNMRQMVLKFDREQPLQVSTISESEDLALSRERLLSVLSSIFGIIGLILSAAGIYSIVSFDAVSRSKEIAIRAALGATRGHLAWIIGDNGLRILAVGFVLGVVLFLGCFRISAHLLSDLRINVFIVTCIAALVTAVAGITGALLPLRQALASAPASGLRTE